MLAYFRKKMRENKRENKDKAPCEGVGGSAVFEAFSCVLKLLNLVAILVTNSYFCRKTKIMQVVSAREFRANQGKYLIKANAGQSLLLTSRYGSFKIVPISEEDNLTTRICKGLQQVKLIEEGKLPSRTIEDLLDEL